MAIISQIISAMNRDEYLLIIVFLLTMIVTFVFIKIFDSYFDEKQSRFGDFLRSKKIRFVAYSLLVVSITLVIMFLLESYAKELYELIILIILLIIVISIIFSVIFEMVSLCFDLNTDIRKKDREIELKEVKNQEKQDYAVFMNYPIRTKHHDVIGFDTQKQLIIQAYNQGANIVGLIADYGSGKSSLVELIKGEISYKVININLWDSYNTDSEKEGSGLPNHTKLQESLMRSFLYQLAAAIDPGFARNVNKRMSGRYNSVSVNFSSRISIISLGLAVGLYFLSAFIATYYRELVSISSLLLLISVFIVVIVLSRTVVAYSLKNNQNVSIDQTDVLDLYIDIAKRYNRPLVPTKHLVVIEDLDRINEKKVVIRFLQDIYRFSNLSRSQFSNCFKYLIAVKHESAFDEQNESGDAIDTQSIYPKIFDYSLYLNKIHYKDMQVTVNTLIKTHIDIFKGLFGDDYEEQAQKPDNFILISKGKNLDIRTIIERLNISNALFYSLKSRQMSEDEMDKLSLSYKKCTAYAYFETTFKTDFYKLLKDDRFIDDMIFDILGDYRNLKKNNRKQDQSSQSKEQLYSQSMKSKKYSEAFIDDFIQTIKDDYIAEDYRMYFYSYPLNSKIYSIAEQNAYNIVINDDYSYETDERYIERAVVEYSGKAIQDALDYINRNKLKPVSVLFKSRSLLNYLVKHNIEAIIGALNEKIIWEERLYSVNGVTIAQTLSSINIKKDKQKLYRDYLVTVLIKIQTYQTSQFVKIRTVLLEALFESKLDFTLMKSYFRHKDSIKSQDPKRPMISEEEVSIIGNDQNVIIELELECDTLDQFLYISNWLNNTYKKIKNRKTVENKPIIEFIDLFYEKEIKKHNASQISNCVCDYLIVNKTYNQGLLDFVLLNFVHSPESIRKIVSIIEQNVDYLTEDQLRKINSLDVGFKVNKKLGTKLTDLNLFDFLFKYYAINKSNRALYSKVTQTRFIDEVKKAYNTDKSLFSELRLEYCRRYQTTIQQGDDLFKPNFPIMTVDEMRALKSVSRVLRILTYGISNNLNNSQFWENLLLFINESKVSLGDTPVLFELLYKIKTSPVNNTTLTAERIKKFGSSLVDEDALNPNRLSIAEREKYAIIIALIAHNQ